MSLKPPTHKIPRSAGVVPTRGFGAAFHRISWPRCPISTHIQRAIFRVTRGSQPRPKYFGRRSADGIPLEVLKSRQDTEGMTLVQNGYKNVPPNRNELKETIEVVLFSNFLLKISQLVRPCGGMKLRASIRGRHGEGLLGGNL